MTYMTKIVLSFFSSVFFLFLHSPHTLPKYVSHVVLETQLTLLAYQFENVNSKLSGNSGWVVKSTPRLAEAAF